MITKKLLFGVGAWFALVAAVGYCDAQGDDSSVYNLPPQNLHQSLSEWGGRQGYQIVYSSYLLRDRVAPAISGNYTPSAALSLILSQACVAPVWVNDHTITVIDVGPCQRKLIGTEWACIPVALPYESDEACASPHPFGTDRASRKWGEKS